MAQNAKDGGKRRYVLVQLPESLNAEKKSQTQAADFCDQLGKPRNIAELTKERLRRAATKVKSEHPLFAGDVGFRCFRLSESNITAWSPKPADLKATLFDHAEHIANGRTASDVLHELLLKLGLDLCVPVRSRTITHLLSEEFRVGGLPALQCLNRSLVVQCLLRQVVVVEPDIAAEGLLQALA